MNQHNRFTWQNLIYIVRWPLIALLLMLAKAANQTAPLVPTPLTHLLAFARDVANMVARWRPAAVLGAEFVLVVAIVAIVVSVVRLATTGDHGTP